MHTTEDNLYSKLNGILLERMAMKDIRIEALEHEVKKQRKELDKMELVLVIMYISSAFSIFIIMESIVDYIVRSLL